MKSLTLLGAFVLTVLNGHAQVDIINTSITEPTAAILYAAFDNKMVVQNTAITATYELKTSTSLVERLSGTEFILKANHRSTTDTLFVYENNKLVFQKIYQINVILCLL